MAQERKLSATDAFALWLPGAHRVSTWGSPGVGGDSSAVQDQLRSVQQVRATWWACAAILADGSVVTWGNPGGGGDISAVQDELRNVQQVQATYRAFAAILADGSVVIWGDPDLVVTALRCKISLGMCSRFRPQVVHLLPSWQMALL